METRTASATTAELHETELHAEVAGFAGELYQRARQLTGRHAEASDLVQDTFVRALRATRRPGPGGEMRPWMMRLLRNLWIDRLRAARRRPTVALPDDCAALACGGHEDTLVAADNDADMPWAGLGRADIEAALGEVPEPQRTTYRLHALEGRSYTELAATLGIPTGTIGTRLLRARRTLRRVLTKNHAKKNQRKCPQQRRLA